jgi:hypothetical protein
MRSLLFVLTGIAVMALAFWAYRENYRTQSELAEVRTLRDEIGRLRESVGVLNAEWAYLNRPDRLRELADLNFDRLQLLPIDPMQFGTVEQVAYPSLAPPEISTPIDTVGTTQVNP